MEERIWAREEARPLTVSVKRSSRDRLWTGFEARLYDVSGGFTDTVAFTKHNVTMLVRDPVYTACRCDGFISRRFQLPGDIDVVPAGYSAAWEVSAPATFLDISISRELMQTAALELGVNPDRVSLMPQLHLRDPQLEHIGWALKAELEAEAPLGRVYADSLGLAAATLLLRRYAPIAPARIAGVLSKRRLQRVIDYIHDHLAQELSLTELAQIANVSASHFKQLFKESTGMPVHQYIIRRRVEYAIDLILRADLPLSEVALQAGFANQSHMASSMRRVTGITPSALRRGSM